MNLPDRAARLAIIAAFLASCGLGADGGPITGGITASIAGNVVAVVGGVPGSEGASAETAPPSSAPPVTVSIDGVPGSSTTTGQEGTFAIEGEFDGRVTLRFETPAFATTRDIEVPAGALVTLSDVVVAPDGIAVDSSREIGVTARIDTIDCRSRTLVVIDERTGGPAEYAFQLLDATRYVGRDGSTVGCTDLRRGDRVRIDGQVDLLADGSRSPRRALEIVVDGQAPTSLSVVEGVVFAGVLADVDCPGGLLTVADERQSTRVAIDGRSTVIADFDGRRLSCGDLERGQQVSGIGRIEVARPDRIAAEVVQRAPVPSATVDVRIAGAVVATDCAASTVSISNEPSSQVVLVRFDDAVIVPPLPCSAIQVGSRVQGVARIDPARPGDALDAVRLEFREPVAAGAGLPR